MSEWRTRVKITKMDLNRKRRGKVELRKWLEREECHLASHA